MEKLELDKPLIKKFVPHLKRLEVLLLVGTSLLGSVFTIDQVLDKRQAELSTTDTYIVSSTNIPIPTENTTYSQIIEHMTSQIETTSQTPSTTVTHTTEPSTVPHTTEATTVYNTTNEYTANSDSENTTSNTYQTNTTTNSVDPSTTQPTNKDEIDQIRDFISSIIRHKTPSNTTTEATTVDPNIYMSKNEMIQASTSFMTWNVLYASCKL